MLESSAEHWDWMLIRMRCSAEARRIVWRRDDAEDVVQEALARAWRSRRSCRTPDAPLPWCLQITRNEAFRLLGQQKTARVEPLEIDRELRDDQASADRDRALLRLDVGRALQGLSRADRMLIGLRYESGSSHSEIAAELEIPEATARVRLHRAQRRLRSVLGDPKR
jgi:RNA polymerase sigma-70 factor, ECF subfamily